MAPPALLRRLSLAAVTCAAFAAAPAHAALDVEHDHTIVTEVGAGDGVVGPGDLVAVTEHVLSNEMSLTGLSGTATLAGTPGVALEVPSSPFTDVLFGGTTSNTTPFRLSLAPSFSCGQTIPVSLALTSATDNATVPFTVGTGTAGEPVATASADVPRVIPVESTADSRLVVSQAGRVKDLRVRIDKLSHPYVGDLTISLVTPSGEVVELVKQRGGAATSLSQTVLAPAGPSLGGGSAPYTGTFAADGPLGDLTGTPMNGTWRLRIKSDHQGGSGTLQGWSLELAPAVCVPQPVAVADASPNPAGIGEQVGFDASRSAYPGGTITGYDWDLDGDGSYETTGATPSRTYAGNGVTTVRLRVRAEDANGVEQTLVDELPLIVTTPPTASIDDPGTPVAGDPVTLTATATDPDGDPLAKFEWDLDGEPGFERSTAATPSVQHTFMANGEHTVNVRVTDADGGTVTASRVLQVANRPPTAAFTIPAPAVVGVPASFDASASADLDGVIAAYHWDLDGNGADDPGAAGAKVTTTYATPGTRNVRLRVVDADGLSTTMTRAVTVTAAPSLTLAATPNPARPGAPVTITATAADTDGTIAAYAWDLDGNGAFDPGATGAAQTRTWTQLGTHTVRVRVTDDAGATTTRSIGVSVVNAAPVPALGASPSSTTAGSTVTFDAGGSLDPDGAIARYEFDLDGDGRFEHDAGATATASRAYLAPGAVTARVRVTDDDGATATASAPLLVVPAGATPPGGGNGSGDGAGAGTTPGAPGEGGVPGTGDAPGPGLGGDAPGADAGPLSATLQAPAIQALAQARRRGSFTLLCAADRAAACDVRLELSAKDARRLKLRAKRSRTKQRLAIGRATGTASGTEPARLKVTITKRARKALKRTKRVVVLARGTARTPGGAQATIARAVLLRG